MGAAARRATRATRRSDKMRRDELQTHRAERSSAATLTADAVQIVARRQHGEEMRGIDEDCGALRPLSVPESKYSSNLLRRVARQKRKILRWYRPPDVREIIPERPRPSASLRLPAGARRFFAGRWFRRSSNRHSPTLYREQKGALAGPSQLQTTNYELPTASRRSGASAAFAAACCFSNRSLFRYANTPAGFSVVSGVTHTCIIQRRSAVKLPPFALQLSRVSPSLAPFSPVRHSPVCACHRSRFPANPAGSTSRVFRRGPGSAGTTRRRASLRRYRSC